MVKMTVGGQPTDFMVNMGAFGSDPTHGDTFTDTGYYYESHWLPSSSPFFFPQWCNLGSHNVDSQIPTSFWLSRGFNGWRFIREAAGSDYFQLPRPSGCDFGRTIKIKTLTVLQGEEQLLDSFCGVVVGHSKGLNFPVRCRGCRQRTTSLDWLETCSS